MIRKIIHIDEEKCNGCGICASACHEGAIDIIDGKAKLTREHFCDGFGDCLPNCPTGAITFEEREAPEYDAEAVKAEQNRKAEQQKTEQSSQDERNRQAEQNRKNEQGNKNEQTNINEQTSKNDRSRKAGTEMMDEMTAKEKQMMAQMQQHTGGCPGARFMQFNRQEQENSMQTAQTGYAAGQAAQTAQAVQIKPQPRLSQWPVQIKLVPVQAPFFDGAKLLIAADCTAYAYANMHEEFIKGRITLIGCPKLDEVDYTDKLTQIISGNDIKSLTIVRMEVPCCGGLQRAAENALRASGKFIPWQVVIISRDGRILD